MSNTASWAPIYPAIRGFPPLENIIYGNSPKTTISFNLEHYAVACSDTTNRQFRAFDEKALCGSRGRVCRLSSQRDKLHEEVRFRLLALLNENPEMSQRELADAVGVSLGSVNYILKALLEKGLVKLNNFKSAEDKRRYSYILTRRGIAEKSALTRSFLIRKKKEYEMLRREIDELQANLEMTEGRSDEIDRNFSRTTISE